MLIVFSSRPERVSNVRASLRVVIADDHPFYRDGLVRLLRRSGIDVVGEVPNGEAAIRVVHETGPDVVVMDLNMPGLSGLEATRRLSEEAPDTRVLVLSVSAEQSDLTEAILAGASGYVLKDGPVEEIVAGIRAAAAGQSLISPRIANLLMKRVRDSGRADIDLSAVRLSGRELDVLGLLAEGKADYEVAELLQMTTQAVRANVTSVLLKLQLENRAQEAIRASRHQLLERNGNGGHAWHR
jgi:DNA-binding NarL/FixJ family response regulator